MYYNEIIKSFLKENNIIYNETDYILQDDGKGAYIKEWNIKGIAKPDLNKIVDKYKLKIVKDIKKNDVKVNANAIIQSKYSDYKQMNILNLLGGYTQKDKDNLISFLNSVFEKEKILSNNIESLKKIDDVINFNTQINI